MANAKFYGTGRRKISGVLDFEWTPGLIIEKTGNEGNECQKN